MNYLLSPKLALSLLAAASVTNGAPQGQVMGTFPITKPSNHNQSSTAGGGRPIGPPDPPSGDRDLYFSNYFVCKGVWQKNFAVNDPENTVPNAMCEFPALSPATTVVNLNVDKPCDPATYQYNFQSFNSSTDMTLQISHTYVPAFLLQLYASKRSLIHSYDTICRIGSPRGTLVK